MSAVAQGGVEVTGDGTGRKHVYAAIGSVMAELSKVGIGKSQTSGVGDKGPKFKFRGIDDVYGALSGLLSKHNIVALPRVLSRESTQRESRNGGALFHTVLEVAYDLVSALDGSMHTVVVHGEAMDSGDKSISKALSIAYKYMAFQAFCIPVEGDNADPDATSHEVKHEDQGPRITREQAQAFFDKAKAKGLPPEEIKALMVKVAGVDQSPKVPASKYEALMLEVA